MPRQPNGNPTIYKSAHDGLYHCWVTVGTKPNGKPDRKHIKREKADDVKDAVDDLRDRIRRGDGMLTGKILTVEQWLAHWLENIVKPKRAYNTVAAYRPIIELHIVPHIGHWRLDGNRKRLEPEHVEGMYAALGKGKPGHPKLAPSYILQVHRVLSRALKDAVRRGRAARNVCTLIDAPTSRAKRIKAFTLTEAQAVIRVAVKQPLAARWLIGILLGPRQGEVLGMKWTHVDLDPPGKDEPYMRIDTQLQRRTWEHGCLDPVACAEPHHRTAKCPARWEHGCTDAEACTKNRTDRCPQRKPLAGCAAHRGEKGCPPLCRPGCLGHARACKQRVGGGLVDADVKSEKGERALALGEVLTEMLRTHRAAEQVKFAERGIEWSADAYVFTSKACGPIDPRRDHEAWEALLVAAGVPDARLHAARHTAGTMMVATGSDIRTVQETLGHADIRVTGVYVDVAKDLKRDAVDRVAAALLDGSLAALLQPSSATPRA